MIPDITLKGKAAAAFDNVLFERNRYDKESGIGDPLGLPASKKSGIFIQKRYRKQPGNFPA